MMNVDRTKNGLLHPRRSGTVFNGFDEEGTKKMKEREEERSAGLMMGDREQKEERDLPSRQRSELKRR